MEKKQGTSRDKWGWKLMGKGSKKGKKKDQRSSSVRVSDKAEIRTRDERVRDLVEDWDPTGTMNIDLDPTKFYLIRNWTQSRKT